MYTYIEKEISVITHENILNLFPSITKKNTWGRRLISLKKDFTFSSEDFLSPEKCM